MLALIPAFPLAGYLVNAFLGRRLTKTVSGGVACLAMVASFVVSLWAALQLRAHPLGFEQAVYTWIRSGDFVVPLAFRVDALSAVMILIITGIGSLIHIYSTAYMHEETDSELARYFSYLNLFAAFMLVLVLGTSLPVLFIGWEGVGLCSYLLIGFWYTKQSAIDAGKKAFVVNRVGDFAFLLGMGLLWKTFGTLDIQTLAGLIDPMAPEAGLGVLSIASLLLFIGATGKSAQIPLYVWLPDAMEGPTPVSALIHAATMVTAGVYMIGRNAVLFAHTPETLLVVAVIGTATALMAGTIGLVQNDIKRVLAYSTVSQLGYMFLAMGMGAWTAGIFHLYTHAFFKALLFLGSGAVIHALAGEQDLRRMGGLRKDLPITYWTFLIGAIAIAGVPPLAGFFSKDEILFRTWDAGHRILWTVGILTSLLTAAYMFRLVFLAFHGERRFGADAHAPAAAHGAAAHPGDEGPAAHGGHGAHGHLHDAPPAMAIALVLLAAGSVIAGFVGVPEALGGSNRIEHFLHPSFQAPAPTMHATFGLQSAPGAESSAPVHADSGLPAAHGAVSAEPHNTELALMAVSVAVAFAGIGLAWYFFLLRPEAADAVARSAQPVHRLLVNKYYVDELYDTAVVQPIKRGSEQVLWKGVDVGLIDGAVNGAGSFVSGSSSVLRRFQSGLVRAYAASLLVGVVAILGYYLWRFVALMGQRGV